MKVLHSDRKKSASCQKILISMTLSHMECKILILFSSIAGWIASDSHWPFFIIEKSLRNAHKERLDFETIETSAKNGLQV